MPTDDLERFCCQNADCDLYGRRGAGNLTVCGHFGKACHRLLYCNACKARANRQRIANLLPGRYTASGPNTSVPAFGA